VESFDLQAWIFIESGQRIVFENESNFEKEM
jgi:hypothetical protein